jgi:hypothetical protein
MMCVISLCSNGPQRYNNLPPVFRLAKYVLSDKKVVFSIKDRKEDLVFTGKERKRRFTENNLANIVPT